MDAPSRGVARAGSPTPTEGDRMGGLCKVHHASEGAIAWSYKARGVESGTIGKVGKCGGLRTG